jgi:hypothetical protein
MGDGVPSSDHVASLTIASWHRWDKRRIRYRAIVHIYHPPSAWNYMGEGSGSRLVWRRPMTRL